MKSIVKSGKTLDDAIQAALEELGAEREDVEVEVLEEPSKGLFGLIGQKEAKVRVTVTYDPVEVAEVFVTKVLAQMGLSATPILSKEEDVLHIDIRDSSDEDKGILIGKRGNTLDSLQYLVSMVINKKGTDHLRVILDVENYRAKREETLIRLAERMGEKAKRNRRPVKLEPMSPYERRVIHSALQGMTGVSTYSEGDEPYRRVVITSK